MKLSVLNISLCLWWLFVLLLANISVSSLKEPDFIVNIMVVCGVVSCFLGGVFANFVKLRKFNTPIKVLSYNSINLFLFITFCFSFYSVLNVYSFVSEYGISAGFRNAVFTVDPKTGESPVLGSLRIQFVISNFIKPFCYFILIGLFFNFLIKNNSKGLFLVLLAIFSISFYSLSRFFVYHIAILFTASLILMLRYNNFFITKKLLKKICLMFILFLLLFVFISSLRGIDDILVSLVDYHVVGLSIFSDEIMNQYSRVNLDKGFSLSSLGLFERLFVIFLNKFNIELVSYVSDNGTYLYAFRDVGKVEPKFMNAFATWYFTLYFDGGVFYVVIYNLIYGFLLSYSEFVFLRFKDLKFFIISVSLFFISYFSVFSSAIESANILLPFLSLILVSRSGIYSNKSY